MLDDVIGCVGEFEFDQLFYFNFGQGCFEIYFKVLSVGYIVQYCKCICVIGVD